MCVSDPNMFIERTLLRHCIIANFSLWLMNCSGGMSWSSFACSITAQPSHLLLWLKSAWIIDVVWFIAFPHWGWQLAFSAWHSILAHLLKEYTNSMGKLAIVAANMVIRLNVPAIWCLKWRVDGEDEVNSVECHYLSMVSTGCHALSGCTVMGVVNAEMRQLVNHLQVVRRTESAH